MTAVEQMRTLYNLGVLALEKWRIAKFDSLEEYGHLVYVGIANKPTDSGDGDYNAFVREWVDRRIELAEVAESLGIEEEHHAKNIKSYFDGVYSDELRGEGGAMSMCDLCDLCACYWRSRSHAAIHDTKIRCSGRNRIISFEYDDPKKICKHFEPKGEL